MSKGFMRVPNLEGPCVMAPRRSLRGFELTSEMELIPTVNSRSTRKRSLRRRLTKKNRAIESRCDDSISEHRVRTDWTTGTLETCSSNMCSRPLDGTSQNIEAYGLASPCGTTRNPGTPNQGFLNESTISPLEGSSRASNTGHRIYALLPRRELHQSPNSSSAESADILDGYRTLSGPEASRETVVYSQPLENVRHESTEKIDNTSDPGPYRRKDSGVFAGRLKANPLRHLATLLRSKLLSHGNFCNLLELANEIHLQAKEKHNTTLRRIYDVVNVSEAAGLMERAVVSRSGKRKAAKGSPLSGSLIRWCSPTTTDGGTTEIVTLLHDRLLRKNEEFKDLEEEVELLQNLVKHRKVRLALATAADIASTSTQFYTRGRDTKNNSNQLLHSSTSNGIAIPFSLLKASRRSDDRNFEVYTHTDENRTQFHVTVSSEHELQPYEWRWILREILKVPNPSLSTRLEDENDELLMQAYTI